MGRLIDADALTEKCGDWYVEEGTEEGFIGTLGQLLSVQPEMNCSEIPNNSDTISRQQAIEPESISEWKKDFREHVDSLDIARDDWKGIIEYIEELPSVQPNHCAEVGKKVLIDRQEALEAIGILQTYKLFAGDDMLLINQAEAQTELMMLPSAQPEIIRCKDCQHRDEYGCCKHWKGLSMSAIPIATDDDEFCSYAKRRQDGH